MSFCWLSLACVTDNAIGDAGASVIAEALKLNPSVTWVDLSGELANACRLRRLARVVLVFTRLRDTVIDNHIGSAGASKVAEALKLSTSVTSVHLSSESALCQRAHVGFVTGTCVVGFHLLARQAMPSAMPVRLSLLMH